MKRTQTAAATARPSEIRRSVQVPALNRLRTRPMARVTYGTHSTTVSKPRSHRVSEVSGVTIVGFGAHSQRKANAASTLAPIAKAAMTTRLEVVGARPDQVSCMAWTAAPVGVMSLTASSPSGIASRGK